MKPLVWLWVFVALAVSGCGYSCTYYDFSIKCQKPAPTLPAK